MAAAPPPDDVDVAVVGAGPAGSAAALGVLHARPGARVVILDRAPQGRDKVCGDGVAPQVQDVLSRLGVPDLLADHVPVHRLRLGFPDGPEASSTMRRPARVVPRQVLDARLLGAALDRGATLHGHRVRRVEVRDDAGGGHVVLDDVLRARVVVGADGAHSVLRTAAGLGAHPRRRTAIALRGYAPVTAGREHEQVIAFPRDFPGDAAWPAYAWSFPIGDGRANVGYGELLPAGGAGPSRARMLQRLDDLLPGAADGGVRWAGHHLPLSSGRARQPGGPVLLAGDALGLVNPLTGEGIHAAVRSGAVAGLVAAHTLAGRFRDAGAAYRVALRRAMGRHLRHMDLVALLARDVRTVAAGVEVAGRDQRVFDTFIDMGLADGALDAHLLAALVRRAGVHGVAATLGSVLRRR